MCGESLHLFFLNCLSIQLSNCIDGAKLFHSFYDDNKGHSYSDILILNLNFQGLFLWRQIFCFPTKNYKSVPSKHFRRHCLGISMSLSPWTHSAIHLPKKEEPEVYVNNTYCMSSFLKLISIS